jgi:hypothetical protein
MGIRGHAGSKLSANKPDFLFLHMLTNFSNRQWSLLEGMPTNSIKYWIPEESFEN